MVENISLEQTIAVGDGANDLPMLHTAGLGVAFHAKPIVRANVDRSISSAGSGPALSHDQDGDPVGGQDVRQPRRQPRLVLAG